MDFSYYFVEVYIHKRLTDYLDGLHMTLLAESMDLVVNEGIRKEYYREEEEEANYDEKFTGLFISVICLR